MLRSLLAAAVLATAAAPSLADAAAPKPADSIDALYVVNASSGSYDGRTLTLHGVAPTVAWFADRPQRATGVEPMRAVTTQLFGDRQASPNAALDLADEGELTGIAALKLSAPRYNARTRTLTYRATRLPSLATTKLGHLEAQRTQARVPRSFHAAALFIDDGTIADAATVQIPAFTDANFADQVLARSDQQLVSVTFSAVWAAPYVAFKPVLRAEVAKRGTSVSIGSLDVDDNPVTTQKYGITGVPTTLVFRNGQPVARQDGGIPESAFDQMLANLGA
jgi:thioredoxin 1